MMLVVASATVATLVVLQQGVEATYRRLAEERFASDVESLAVLRAERLGAVKSRSLELVRSVRLVALFIEGDVDRLYQVAASELRDVLVPPPDAPRARAARFFR